MARQWPGRKNIGGLGAVGLEGLIPRKDEDHASTEEVPAGVAGEGDAAGA